MKMLTETGIGCLGLIVFFIFFVFMSFLFKTSFVSFDYSLHSLLDIIIAFFVMIGMLYLVFILIKNIFRTLDPDSKSHSLVWALVSKKDDWRNPVLKMLENKGFCPSSLINCPVPLICMSTLSVIFSGTLFPFIFLIKSPILMITGLLIVLIPTTSVLLYPIIKQKKLVSKYRDLEEGLIKP